jgi:hypothetical protein
MKDCPQCPSYMKLISTDLIAGQYYEFWKCANILCGHGAYQLKRLEV